MQRVTVVYRVWAVSHQLPHRAPATETLLTEEGEHWSGSTSGNVPLTVPSQMADALSRIDCMVSTRFQEIGVRWPASSIKRSTRCWMVPCNHKSPGIFFRASRATLAVSRAYCTVITTHNNHHPAHYARRRDSGAYMKLPGVFLYCDTCAKESLE